MMAKIIIYGEDRNSAIAKAKLALEQLEISGLPTNQTLLLDILSTQEVSENTVTTSWLGEKLKDGKLL